MKKGVKTEATQTAEHKRLKEPYQDMHPWRRWGPYVSERAWATVREDYSSNGEAWDYFPHNLARSKAYRWGEDGLAGICDRYQLLVFALALWNTRDPILKERAFGVVPSEGNHGEDVKEYYFYLDNTPTHSYMKYLYKYPQAEYPYQHLVDENRRRQGSGLEYELLDTGIFDDDRYFDVFVEYGKAGPEDICIKIEAFNRGPEEAPLQIIPHLWFRNTWAWTDSLGPEPSIRPGPQGDLFVSLLAEECTDQSPKNIPFQYKLGPRYLYADKAAEMLFTDNETNGPRVYGPGAISRKPFVKDAFHRYIIHGEDAVNPARVGTKSCLRYEFNVPARESVTVRLRLVREPLAAPLDEVDRIIAERKAEADEFYETIHPRKASDDERMIQRQALAGLLWSKQIYLYDVDRWLEGDDPNLPPPRSRCSARNAHWRHLNSMRILSMPDKWEYPWFAAWDLAFHCVAFTLIDPEFAKEQLWLMLFEQFQHPDGQIPAYEWEFSDKNPPVHAWACWRVYNMDRIRSGGRGDRAWLEKCFHKLLMNFAWWINKVDSEGNNIFEGGFMGLDNITVLDRSEKHADQVTLEQSDATGWMGMFCLNLMRIALELSKENKVYESLATKFFQHYIYVGAAMKNMRGRNYSLWDEKDGFFYDVLVHKDKTFHKFSVRSLVGLIPMYAIERLEVDWIEPFKEFSSNLEWFTKNRQDIVQRSCYKVKHDGIDVYVLAIFDENQMKGMLERVYNSDEFLSDYGIRSLSKYHEEHPFLFGDAEVRYEPAETNSKIKGGNSNWRGPVWFPTTFLIIESLRKLGKAYGPDFSVPVPGDPSRRITLTAMAEDIANRMISIFTRNEAGERPLYAASKKFQQDPHWRDYLLFYEYFHGDNGAGIGASHQTGWTALVASLIDEWRR